MDNLVNVCSKENDSIKSLAKTMATVECNIDSSSKGGVGKLLSISSKVTYARVEKAGDTHKIFATLNCKVIFLNKEGELESYDYLSDFNTNVDINNYDNISFMWAMSGVMDMDSTVKGDIICIQAVIDMEVVGLVKSSCNCVCEVEDNILVKYDKKLIQQNTNVRDTFMVEDDYESGCNIEKVLYFDSDVMLSNTKAYDDKIIASGDVSSIVVYLSEGIVASKVFSIPFTEEISLKGVTESDKLILSSRVVSSKVILSGVEGENLLSCHVEVSIMGFSVKEECVNVIEDLHSSCNKIDMTYCTMPYTRFLEQKLFQDKITGSANLDEELPPASKVLSTIISRQIIANTYRDKDMLNIEGILSCNVIYTDCDDSIHSVLVELPYSLQYNDDSESIDCEYLSNIMVSQLYSKIKRDREIEVTAMINISISKLVADKMTAVADYSLGDKIERVNHAVSIYQTSDGESLWNIAKAMNAPIEDLVIQNNGLKDIAHGQKVIYYRRLQD